MEFKYVSLFSGVDGFAQALNSLGGECVLTSDVDPFVNKAHEILYGQPTKGDVTKIAAEDVPNHDILTGGFPCPTFSVAGDRDGMEYECSLGHSHLITYQDYKQGPQCPFCGSDTEPKDFRGVLFFEIARISEYKQPKALILENVKGLISSAKGEVMRIITQTLNEIGYTIDFEVLNSKFYVPQNRERIFIIALRNDLVVKPRWNTWNVDGRNDVVAKGKKKLKELHPYPEAFNFKWPEQTEVTMKLRDILEPEVEDKFYLSEDKTANLVASLPTPELNDGSNISYCLDASYAKGVAPSGMGKGRRTHVLAIREATKAGYAVATEGGAVNFQFPESKTRRGRVGKQIAQTLEASSINQGIVTPEYRIRKLTPKECFRLQGFSDEVFDKLQAGGISNSQLYRMAGNAVTVNVVEAIAKNLLPYLKN
jgi:DNA (cytosine-5)-methyltransferase 1